MQAGDEEEEEEWLNKVTGLLTYVLVCTHMYSGCQSECQVEFRKNKQCKGGEKH